LNCINNMLRYQVASYACEFDCRYVAVLAKRNGNHVGVVYSVVPRDVYCHELPITYVYACIAVVEAGSEDLFNAALDTPQDGVIYAVKQGKHIMLIFDCSANEVLQKAIYESLCVQRATTEVACVDEIIDL